MRKVIFDGTNKYFRFPSRDKQSEYAKNDFLSKL